MSGGFARELGRKAFHFLCLVYLAFFHWQGTNATLAVLGCWIGLVVIVERLRLSRPEVNAYLLGLFRGIHRADEERKMSGIVWTSLGCWLTILAFGAAPRLVDGGLLMLAFGDAAAALVGKSLGRRRFVFRGKQKSLEGSLACLGACLAVGVWLGFPPLPVICAAVAAAAVELAAPPPDDNFWLPLVSACVLSLA